MPARPKRPTKSAGGPASLKISIVVPALISVRPIPLSRTQSVIVAASAPTTKTAWVARTSDSAASPNSRASSARTAGHSGSAAAEYRETFDDPSGAGLR
jgi:hypothetical protein